MWKWERWVRMEASAMGKSTWTSVTATAGTNTSIKKKTKIGIKERRELRIGRVIKTKTGSTVLATVGIGTLHPQPGASAVGIAQHYLTSHRMKVSDSGTMEVLR
jgi:hypothetical protein